MPAKVTEQEFKEFLDLNKINYVKDERLTSKKDGRVLEMFKLEIKDDTEAGALITENSTCPITAIIYRVEEFLTPNFHTAVLELPKFRPKLVGPKLNVLSGGRATIIKDAKTKRKSSQNAPTVKDHMLHPTKGVQHTKIRHLDNMWWTVKSHMPQLYAKTRLNHNLRIRHSPFRLNNL